MPPGLCNSAISDHTARRKEDYEPVAKGEKKGGGKNCLRRAHEVKFVKKQGEPRTPPATPTLRHCYEHNYITKHK